jgi:hypothetical protein
MQNNNGSQRTKINKIQEANIIKASFYRILVVVGIWSLVFLVYEMAGETDHFVSDLLLLGYVIIEIISSIAEIQTQK